MDPTQNTPSELLRLIEVVAKATIAFYRFLPSEGDVNTYRKTLLEEVFALGGVANTMKALVDDNSKQTEHDGQTTRLRNLEALWAPDGVLTQCKNQIALFLADLNAVDREDTSAETRPSWPLHQSAMDEQIEKLQQYKKIISKALYEAFCGASRVLGPTEQMALDTFAWLEIIDTSEKQEFLSRQRHEDTVSWVFEKESCTVYHEWASATEGAFLWLRGKAGAGKSVTAAAIVDELSKKSSEEEFLAYFFCDFRDVRTSRTPTILKTLFAQFLQIAERELVDLFPDLVQRHSDGLPPPSEIEVLLDLLLRAMKLHKRKVIVIDGLNECNDVPTVLSCLEKISAEEHVRLLVTSRPEQIFVDHLAGRPTMALEDYIEFANKDMRNSLLKQMMDHFRLRAIPSGTKTEVQDSMVTQADGSFWYAQCQLDSLHVCRSVGGVYAIIENLPPDLDRTYDNILFRVNKMSKDLRTIVQMTVRWLGGAVRPLAISQVIEAAQIEINKPVLNDGLTVVSEEDLLFICGGLIKLDDQTTGISLAHRTMLEYLTKPPSNESISMYFFDAHEVHRDLALRSISYILTEDIVRGIEKSNKTSCLFESSKRRFFIDHCPMIPYVFDGGFEHLQHITKESDEVIDLLTKLQVQVKEQPEKYAVIVESLHDRVEGKPYEWILDEEELVLGVLIRFGPPWMLKRFLLRHRPDLARGEEIEKLLSRVKTLGGSAELLTDRKFYEFVGQ